jgi:hypothetical protein
MTAAEIAAALAEAEEMYALYLLAEKSILKGQSYQIGNRALTRANLAEVVEQRKWWKDQVDRLSTGNGAPRVTQVIPRDS